MFWIYIQEFSNDPDTGKVQKHNKLRVSMNVLPQQCGLVYKGSENHMFESGRMPFTVKVEGA